MPWFKYYLFNQDELITLGLFCVWVSFNHITLLCYYPLPSFISLYHCLLNKIIVCFIILNIYASICVYTVSLSIRIFKLPWSFSFSFNKESQPHISHYLNPQWLFFPNRTYQLIHLKHIEKIWRAKESRRSRGRKLHTFGIAYRKGRWQRRGRKGIVSPVPTILFSVSGQGCLSSCVHICTHLFPQIPLCSWTGNVGVPFGAEQLFPRVSELTAWSSVSLGPGRPGLSLIQARLELFGSNIFFSHIQILYGETQL